MPRRRQTPGTSPTASSPRGPDPVSGPGQVTRPLDEAWGSATTIGPPGPEFPFPQPGEGEELLRRAQTLPDLLGELGISFTPEDATGPGEAAAKLIARGGRVGRAVGKRIPSGGQASLPTEFKIPRFRSPAGDFVRYQNKWWRLKPFRADTDAIELEYLGKGAKDLTSKVLKTKTVPMKQFYDSVLKAKGTKP